jgi:hypothetical protein
LSNPVTVTVLNEACSPGLSPDLAAIDIKPSASSGRVGDAITVNVELANRGNAWSRASTARIRFGRGPSVSTSDLVLTTIALPSIEFGADIQRTTTIKLPAVAAGTYYLFLTLDEEHFSGEDRTDNNVKASAAFALGEMIQPRRRAATH